MYPFSVLRKLTSALPGYSGGGVAALLDTAADVATIDVRHMTNIEIYVKQIIDAGTVTLDIERTLDGVNWDPVGSMSEASFPAGANTAQSLLLVDANGMPMLAKQVRVRATALAGGGTYDVLAYGQKLVESDGERLIIENGVYDEVDFLMNQVGDNVVFSAKGLTNIEVMLNQVTDPGAGTSLLTVSRSCDGGVTWDELGTKADTDFAAAANTSTPVPLSGTGGRPLHADLVRVVLTALSAGGAYSAHLVGIQTPGFR